MSRGADGGTASLPSGVPTSVIRRANPLGEAMTNPRPGPLPVAATTWAVPAGMTRLSPECSTALLPQAQTVNSPSST